MVLSLAGAALLIPLEKAFNGLLAQDPHAGKSLARFRGKLVEARTPRGGFSLRFEDPGVRLGALHPGAPPEAPDVIIAGPARHLLAMLRNPRRPPPADGAIRIEGDAELLLELQQTLLALDVQWEDLLQPLLGDALAGGLGETVAGARDWTRKARGNVRRNLANYLQYESGAMPTPEELATFSDRVDDLRLRLDRLQARTDILLRAANADSAARQGA